MFCSLNHTSLSTWGGEGKGGEQKTQINWGGGAIAGRKVLVKPDMVSDGRIGGV